MGERALYLDDLAEQLKAHAGEKYRPSNGSEGEMFQDMWCAGCKRDQAFREAYARNEDADGCSIIADAMAFSVDHPGYPDEWQYGKDGQPKCTAFDPINGMPERCHETPDMFAAHSTASGR